MKETSSLLLQKADRPYFSITNLVFGIFAVAIVNIYTANVWHRVHDVSTKFGLENAPLTIEDIASPSTRVDLNISSSTSSITPNRCGLDHRCFYTNRTRLLCSQSQESDLLLIRKMPFHSHSIVVPKKYLNILIISSVRGTSLPLISHTRATFNSRTGEVQLPEQSGKPDDIEIECPKNERRSCGKNSFGEFLLNAARAKKVYADQHGYRFVLMDSNDFKGERGSGGRTGEFAKPHMMRHALLDPNLCGWQQQVAPETFRGKCDWIMWLDADSFIHPALFDLPLDAWLHDVPDDRILVLGNRVALNTGVLFLRAGNQSTRTQTISLLDNWVTANKLIHCHSFDQAGLQLLLLRAVRRHLIDIGQKGSVGTHASPFGFTCVSPWCSQNLTKNRQGKNVPFWSCNPLFDKKLVDSGWHDILLGRKNHPRLDGLPIWISRENSRRPRLHVVEKHKIGSDLGPEGVPTVVQGWDYGGNFNYNFSEAPHSPTWFITHHKQTASFFFEGHQSQRACRGSLHGCHVCPVLLEVTRFG